ncbi:glycoside hydrolase family 97 protein [Fibrella forsythiae]|uniref:Glycoside hydrolase family 97 catalytic domain-containing protein n=1 Tax=Fibrella forsythiae TaxID=2817061 RepID=A0ABS3JLG6_9BACT|nr:glycoside hydrolase family 97 protein [Fibrella forsythiae]MBO0950847.1 glycoside hydrolase family 97 catalytic domain-containing protein [Fibrella forsythiae]
MPGRSALFGWLIGWWLLSSAGLAAPTPKSYQASSPDKTTRIEVTIDDHKALVYRVWFADEPVLTWSALGVELNSVAVGPNTVVKKQRVMKHTESFAWRLGENDVIHNNYTELTLDCLSGSVTYQLVARVFNGSVAFRYVLPKQAGTDFGKVRQELTTFVLPDAHTIYQYNEETVFTPTALADLQKTCDFPATLTNGRLFLSIGEADNTSYTKAVLSKGAPPNTLAVSFRKNSVLTKETFQTPWRTVSVATSAIGLHAFSDLPLRLCPPSSQPIPDWVKPGKLIRSSLTTQGGLNCIDFAATHNFQYILFDAGWYGAEFRTTSDPTQVIPAIDLPTVIQYGKAKNIGVILYVNRVALRARLDELLPLYKQWGVAGLKFGFVDGLTQEGISWLVPAIKKVYDHGFILDIHDNYKPTGLSRTYPNLLTQEGVRGNENNPDAFHNTMLPFTRFLAGAADYTFCYPNTNRYFTDNLYKSKLQVSKGQQLALSVVYFSPLQAIFWYGNPTDYNDEGEIEFFKRVPTVWNESHYLAGEPGTFISVARRQGTTWYVGSAAGLMDWSGTLPLSFLAPGKRYQATSYEDDGTGGIQKRVAEVGPGDTLPISLKAKGGQALILDQKQ